jgi:cysteinyl-tRNA synthetase
MKLHNTLSHRKETFMPTQSGQVGMYVCGPTVYDRAHIGNARSTVVFDLLFRIMRQQYGADNVTYVRNITDIDDKIIKAAHQNNESIELLTSRTIRWFHDDMQALGCLAPSYEPKATDCISEMIAIITRLIASGNAYVAENHVLFDVSSDSNYGHLSRRPLDEMIAGARVEVAPYKKNPQDFVLWKPSAADEPGWPNPWQMGGQNGEQARGRPGWHIECTAMSHKHLGENFDIHGGGADLTFPHHENEIAQGRCAFPSSLYAKYWVHNGFLTVNGEKMSKSLGNFITMNQLLEQGITGEAIRYALLTTHYRKPLDWNDNLVSQSEQAIEKIYAALGDAYTPHNHKNDAYEIPADNPVLMALLDDMNTPLALAELHKLLKNGRENIAGIIAACQLLGICQSSHSDFMAKTFKPDRPIDSGLKARLDELVELRSQAKLAKNWEEADRIRSEAMAMGYKFIDTPQGTTYEIA